ncbi:MAG: sulfite exporter TauE/SafE family protein [Bacteroidetes bacterium]|nr:MAG: sulfite exporter TauE/SafE family protein [Bacteroidota bacterium]
MEIYLAIAYGLALVTGLVLGTLGGGGSILILPILVYLVGIDASVAVVYSLFMIAGSSLVGSISHFRMGNVRMELLLWFGIPSIVSVLLTRRYLFPIVPEKILDLGSFELTRSILILVLFALLMLLAAFFMLRKKKTPGEVEQKSTKITWGPLVLQGVFMGFVTGFLGAGGGFLIVPALLFFAAVEVRQAIGTSLSIIALNTAFGFLGSIGTVSMDWGLILPFSALMIIGILLGARLSKGLKQDQLKRYFAYFILAMALFMLSKELVFSS